MSKNILVTGGAGFIGSHIVEELLKLGYSVRVLDNFTTGRKENLEQFKDKIEIIEGDIRDIETVNSSMKDINFVFHEAALTSVNLSMKEPVLTNDINVRGTINLLKSATENKVEKFVVASTAAVYGNNPTLPKSESMIPEPISPYAVSKLSCEYYCKIFNDSFGLKTVALRYFNVYGPRQDPKSEYSGVISIFIDKIKSGQVPAIFGDGKQSRDFVFVKDIVKANLLAAFSDVSGVSINVATGEPTDLNNLVEEINNSCSSDIKPIYSDPRDGDIKHSLADISLSKKILNYNPSIKFNVGISLTINSL